MNDPALSASAPAVIPARVPAGSIVDYPRPFTVFATNAGEMQASQQRLVSWAKGRVEESLAAVEDLTDNFAIAKKNGWGTSAIYRAKLREEKRLVYYQKILVALDAGYHLVPNFPVDLFAVRTNRDSAPFVKSRNVDGATQLPATALPVGEGNYVSGQTKHYTGETTEKRWNSEQQKDVLVKVPEYRMAEFQDVDFPFAVAKQEILSATAEAMALKVFDQMGALSGHAQPAENLGGASKGDPLIIGQILMKSSSYQWKVASFLIAWFVDTKDL